MPSSVCRGTHLSPSQRHVQKRRARKRQLITALQTLALACRAAAAGPGPAAAAAGSPSPAGMTGNRVLSLAVDELVRELRP